jgi:hypothetical protein
LSAVILLLSALPGAGHLLAGAVVRGALLVVVSVALGAGVLVVGDAWPGPAPLGMWPWKFAAAPLLVLLAFLLLGALRGAADRAEELREGRSGVTGGGGTDGSRGSSGEHGDEGPAVVRFVVRAVVSLAIAVLVGSLVRVAERAPLVGVGHESMLRARDALRDEFTDIARQRIEASVAILRAERTRRPPTLDEAVAAGLLAPGDLAFPYNSPWAYRTVAADDRHELEPAWR